MTDHYRDIYTTRAADYHRMIAAEDADRALRPLLQDVAPLAGARLVDVGSGTGRIPLLVHDLAASIVALDLHRAMLVENGRQRDRVSGRWGLAQADAECLPLADGVADVTTAGWVFGHFCGWYHEEWRAHAGRAVDEMVRITRPGGTLVILETLGTGATEPAPPRPMLADYYRWLEEERGFARRAVATDYLFDSPDEARRGTQFFFGESLAGKIAAGGWSRIPEWTGLWSRRR